jgi:hypothetical protein
MRFRARFGAVDYFWIAGLCLYIVIPFVMPHRRLHFADLPWIGVASFQILTKALTWWDLDSEGLRQRCLWYTKEISWREVFRVGGLNSKPASRILAIDYARPAPMSDRGQILASPGDRAQFLAALHRFAPTADFEV